MFFVCFLYVFVTYRFYMFLLFFNVSIKSWKWVFSEVGGVMAVARSNSGFNKKSLKPDSGTPIPHPRKSNPCRLGMVVYMDGGVYGCWCIWLCGIVGKIFTEPSKGAAQPRLCFFLRGSCQQCHKAIYTNIHIPQHPYPPGFPIPLVLLEF